MVTRSKKVPPVAKVADLLWLTDEEKMGLTKRELVTVDKVHRGEYTVRISATKEGFWMVEIIVDETGRTYEVDTTRGMTRGWRQIEQALRFVKESCPNARTVRIEMEDWVLEKTSRK